MFCSFAPFSSHLHAGKLLSSLCRATSFVLLVPVFAAAVPCTLNPASPSVTICTPANGASISSPVTVTAATTDNSHPVTAMIAYVDNAIAYRANANQLTTSLSLSAGKHNITVNAWDSSGAVFKSTSVVTVSGAGTAPVSVAISPSTATLAPATQQQFSATVLNATNTSVTWSVDGFVNGNTTVGIISTTGLYTAPAANGTHTIVATSTADSSKSDSAIVTVTSSAGGAGGACSPASGSPSVTICSPSAGATVPSPVQISATGNSSTAITKMLVYIDNTLQYQTTTSSTINTSIPIANGPHSLTVQFYNGTWVKQSESFTVTSSTPITVTISPTSATIAPNATQQFSASVSGTTNTAVNWSVDGIPGGNSTAGIVTTNGLYTGPSSAGGHTVTATSQASSASSASASVTVNSGNGNGCSPSSAAPAVTICKPAVGATVSSPVTVSAVDNSATPISKTLVYVDSVLQYQTTDSSVNTSLAIGSGTHNLTVQFYNGSWIKQSENFTVSSATSGSANVLTWHYDNQRTGLNPSETELTTANVNANSFGKLFTYIVDGYVYAQPLYLSNLTVNGAVHNVVFVATENDSIYAFDADSYGTGTPLWQRSLLQSGETPVAGSIKPVLGITSTPVIDSASSTMYVVSAQKTSTRSFFRLHAIDLATGTEKFGGPAVISASVAGTNSDSVNGVVSLTTACVQRAALLLADNTVFIGFGGCHSGWLLSYDAQSLTQTGVFNASPNTDGYGEYGGAGGIWMGGGGPAADSNGSVYVTTGNGPYDGSTSFGDSVLRFNAQLQLLDTFTPYDWSFLQCRDADMSAGGLMLIPGASRALVGGKTGELYLVNTANLGGIQANDAGAAQSLWFEQDLSPYYSTTCTDNKGSVLTGNVTSYQIYGSAAFFNGSAYLGVTPSVTSTRGPVRRFTYANGQLTPASVTPDSIAPNSYGTTPFISANGSSNGIVWVLDHGLPIQDPDNVAATSAVLRAYDANNMATELYNSQQNSADAAGLGIKFTSPIVANGKVFIGAGHDAVTATSPRGELDVYGLK